MFALGSRLAVACCGLALACAVQAEQHNTLTPEEKAAGWQLLFNGLDYANWTGMKGSPLPIDRWAIEDGALRTIAGPGRDLASEKAYDDFELTFDVKILKGGNSGVKYLVQQEWLSPHWSPVREPAAKERERLSAVGHEYQILDDAAHGKEPGWEKGSLGSFYLIYAPDPNKKPSPPGEWNSCKIVVDGVRVEHWLNGDKILEYELGTRELFDRVLETKFRVAPGFGMKARGYVVLTHHNAPAWFRNVKIRELN